MRSVINKTRAPLSVPLPRGKKLHLGPGKTGQIASNALDHPALKKLIDAGEIEVVAENSGSGDGAWGTKAQGSSMPAQGSAGISRRSGDR